MDDAFSSAIAMVAGSLSFGVNPPLLRCCRYRFRPYGGLLLADARMAGPAKSKQKVFAPGIRPDFVGFTRSIVVPGARREGPSLAHRGSRGIHAAQPLDSLRSPSGPACGCYFAALRFTTIPLGLLTGHLASSVRSVFQH